MRQIRILKRIIIETWIGLRQSGWSNWLVVSILAIALTIFGGILQLTMTLKNIVGNWGSQLEISAYLTDGYDPKAIARELSQIPGVQFVEIVSKDAAWEEMKSTLKVAGLANPLPNTLHIRLTSAEKVEAIAPQIKLVSGIENIRYPLKVAKRINEIRHFLEIAGLFVTSALAGATLIVISNTIHLVIQARHREIEILSLMGVSPSYIKSPLIFQGAAYGTIASLLSIAVLSIIHIYLDPYLSEQLFSFIPQLATNIEYGTVQTLLAMVALGVAVGAGGSFWTSGRYIKS